MRRIVFFVGLLFLSASYAESKGESLFQEGKFLEAIPVLEEEIQNGVVSADTYNYLGIAYLKNEDYDKAIDAFERGMQSPVSDVKQLYFNEGNVAFIKGDYTLAEMCFSLALEASPEMYTALLNRANARLALAKYNLALKDYTDFITACPEDEQIEKINAMVSYIKEQIAFEEDERRLLAEEYAAFEAENRRVEEEALRKAEEKTLEEEKKRLAEEEMQRRILDDMSNSLQTEIEEENTENELGYEQVNETELSDEQSVDAGEKDEREELELEDEQVRELEWENERAEKNDERYEQIEESELKPESDAQNVMPELDYEHVIEVDLAGEGEEGAESDWNDKSPVENELNYERVIDSE